MAKRLRKLGLQALLLLLLLEGLAWSALWVVHRATGLSAEDVTIFKASVSDRHRKILKRIVDGESQYFVHSPVLGWTIKPGGARGAYRANAQGLRADREYEIPRPDGVLRIAAFGDSMVHSDDVGNAEMWTEEMARARQGMEVLNFGVSGYGLDQAYLRYVTDGLPFEPHIVLMGFTSENLHRGVSVFRPFYGRETMMPLAKPRFILRDGELELLDNPLDELEDYRRLLEDPAAMLPAMGRYDHHYNIRSGRSALDISGIGRFWKLSRFLYYSRFSKNRVRSLNGLDHAGSEAFAVSIKLFERFYREALSHDSLPIVVILGSKYDLGRMRANQRKSYQPLIEHLQAADLRHVDLVEAFETKDRSYSGDEVGEGHYTELGNEIVGRYLVRWLEDRDLIVPGKIRAECARLRERFGVSLVGSQRNAG